MCHSEFLGLQERGGGAAAGRTIATGADLGDKAGNASQGEVSQGRDRADGTIQAQAKRGWLSLAAETDRGGRGSFLPRCKQTATWLVFWALELFSGSAAVLPALTTAWLQPQCSAHLNAPFPARCWAINCPVIWLEEIGQVLLCYKDN